MAKSARTRDRYLRFALERLSTCNSILMGMSDSDVVSSAEAEAGRRMIERALALLDSFDLAVLQEENDDKFSREMPPIASDEEGPASTRSTVSGAVDPEETDLHVSDIPSCPTAAKDDEDGVAPATVARSPWLIDEPFSTGDPCHGRADDRSTQRASDESPPEGGREARAPA